MSLQVPWDFSYKGDEPEGDLVPNMPSPEGERAGRELARITEAGKAKLLREGLACGTRCDECAFTLGTVPNRCLPTVGDALKCVVEGIPFACHKGSEPGERTCGGWLDAVASFAPGGPS